MSRPLADRLALVTGAGGAIGTAVVRSLREQGACVVGADLLGRHLGQACPPWEGEPVALDVRIKAQITDLVSAVAEQAGAPVDTLVNVAGVVSFGSAQDLEEQEWDRVMAINLKGSFLAAQAVMPGMRRLGFGRIVNLGSVVGKNSGNARPWIDPAEQQRASNVAYGISKAGIHSMTGFLARELASSGVTVNAVAPGPIATAMTTAFPAALQALIPRGRMGTPEDVARAVSFLVQREADFITGEVLDVNGGMWSD